MDSRSPLAFLQQNIHLNTFPRLVNPKSSPRSSPAPVTPTSTSNGLRPSSPASQKPSPSVKRKASFQDDNDDEDSIMSTSPNPSPRILKRARQSSTSHKRNLPISRILDNLDKPALVSLFSTLLSRHPDLANEIQSLAPKITPQIALNTITKLEVAFQTSFPYGGDKGGEYAYSRVHATYNALLSAVADYTIHFLPPTTTISPPELLSFLDSITHLLHRIPVFQNPIHNIARETAFVDITRAWELAIRYFVENNGSFAFMLGGWLERLESHANKEGVLRRVVDHCRGEISWARSG